MKIIVALVLCGFACVWASPTCNESEMQKNCVRTKERQDDIFPETAEELDELCGPLKEELDCTLEFTDRCPHTLTGAFSGVIRKFREDFGRICDHEDSLRDKYLSKVSCLNENVKNIERECSETVTVQEYCAKTFKLHQCAEDKVSQTCGENSKEVFEALNGPRYNTMKSFCQ